jgi:hypothetical protein
MTRAARRFVPAVLTTFVLAGVSAGTQSVSAPGLKAGYLFTFTKFVEWPADVVPAGAPLSLCVVDDSAVVEVLAQTIKGRAVDGHGLTVRHVKSDTPLPTCHVLYLAGSDPKRTLDIVGSLDDVLVLTVSDAAGFAKTGGMVELFIEEGRMRFAVNVDAVERAHLRLSSRVLALAKIVRDDVTR